MSDSGPNSDFKKGEVFLSKALKYFHNQKFKNSKEYLEAALSKFQETKAIFKQAEVYEILGKIAEMEGDNLHALDMYQQTAEFRVHLPNILLKGQSLQNTARINLYLSHHEKALDQALKAYDLFERAGIRLKNAEISYLIGQIHYGLEDWKSAEFYYSNAKELLQSQDHPHLHLLVIENYAYVLHQLGKLRPAISNYLFILAKEHQLQNYAIILKILRALHENYIDLGKEFEAQKMLDDYSEIIRHIWITFSDKEKGNHLFSMASMQFNLGHLDKAETICDEAISLFEITKNSQLVGKGLFLMAKILSNQNFHDPSLSFTEIEEYLKEANKIASENHLVPQIVDILLLNNRIAQYRGEPEKSTSFLSQAKKVAEEEENDLAMGMVFEELAINAYNQGDYEQAFKDFSTTEEKYLRAKNFRKIAEIKYNLACVAAQLSIPENVIENLKESFNLNPKFRKLAKKDDDFRGLENNTLFRETVYEP
ncbi:MAG: TPR end-of-group domain-containing protein [Promethearchaeota archaeon]